MHIYWRAECCTFLGAFYEVGNAYFELEGCELKPELPVEPVLVGRDKEIEQLTRYLDSAFHGKGVTVLVGGEAGVGKTRFVNEFLSLAKKAGAKILKGWCLGEVAVPYLPFTEAFNTYMTATSDEKAQSSMTKELGITGWIKGIESARESKASELLSTPQIKRDRTFEAVERVLSQLSDNEPLVLFLDDLHWADRLSLGLLHYLTRKFRNSRLLIIGTYRPEEIVRAKDGKLHPLEETMFSMSREDLLVKIDLNRLQRTDFPELLESIFRSSLEEEFAQKLYEETEGNPLFALETLKMLVAEGSLSEKEGRWILIAPTERIGIPSKVHDVILRRVERLGRGERKLLELAAVYGFSFTPATLSRILALDITDALQTLVEIERRHRLIRSADSTFEFTHHQIREVTYANLPSELRRIYHLKTASCLEQVLAEEVSDSDMADIALHFVEGGAPEKAFQYLVKLGEKAVNIFANVQAIDYLNKALEAAQEAAGLATSENLAKIHKLRGKAWLGQGEIAKTINDFDLLLQNATSLCDESLIAEAHYWLGRAHADAGKGNKAITHFTRALKMAQKLGNKFIENRSLSMLAGLLSYSLDTIEEGLIGIKESIEIAKEMGDKVTEAHSLYRLGLHYNWKGEFDRARENLNDALALAEEVGDNFRKIDSLIALSLVSAGKGEYNDAISTLQRCLQISRDLGIVYFVPRALNVLGWIYHDLSSIELALKHNNEALKTARTHQESIGIGSPQPACLANLGMDYLFSSDYEKAKKYFHEAHSLIRLHRWVRWRFEIRILQGLGEISLAKGEFENALKSVEDSLVKSEKAGAKKYIAKGLKLKAEVLANTGNLGEAVELMEDALKLAQQVGNPPILWQTHHSLGLLLKKRGDLQEANEHHGEAIALIEATAAKLSDPSLKNSLLNAPLTSAIRDAYTKTKPTS